MTGMYGYRPPISKKVILGLNKEWLERFGHIPTEDVVDKQKYKTVVKSYHKEK